MNSVDRSVYRRQDMRRLLAPESVALVGASSNPSSLGGRTLSNLLKFGGRFYPVNARHVELMGRKCYPSVTDLPESPDCVVLAVPQDAVAAVAAECIARGAGALVVLASGYAELSADEGGSNSGAHTQEELARVTAAAGVRVVGPNCVGVARQANVLHAAFAEFPPGPSVKGARIGLVAQSGALGLGLSHAAERGMSVSHVLTCGNSCDVDVADYVAWLVDDEDCDAIALVFEGLNDSRRLRQAAVLAREAGKRIVACKLGASAGGQAAARFHTNTTTGNPEFWNSFFAGEQILQVARIECLMETAAFLAKAPRMKPGSSHGVAVVSGSGGTAILAIDAAARHGVLTPQPGASAQARLRAAVPAFGSPRNPCDATAQATRNPQSLLDCMDAMLADERYGALVIPWGRSQRATALEDIGQLARQHGKPVCIAWMSQYFGAADARVAEMNPDLALFYSLDNCFDALAQWFALG